MQLMDEPKTCDLRARLFRFAGGNASYDSKAGLRRSMALWGWIDDSADDGSWDSRFHGRGIRISIYAPRNLDWEDELKRREEIDSVCGLARINANMTPELFQFDDGQVEGEPVHVQLLVSDEAFDVIDRKVSKADECLLILDAAIEMKGTSLPDKKSSWRLRSLEDLDLSEAREYAVGSFVLQETRSSARWHRRVLATEPASREPYGESIQILLTELRYDLDVERCELNSVSCEGRLINRGACFSDHVDAFIDFDEYEANPVTEELPQRAFAGEFAYRPRRPEEDHLASSFSLRLLYMPNELREILLPVLNQDAGTELVLLVTLVAKKADLSSATGELRGNVRRYSFTLRRRLLGNEES